MSSPGSQASALAYGGARPTVLSVDETAYCQVQHFRALATGSTYIDSHVTVIRRRAVAAASARSCRSIGQDAAPVDLDIRIEARSEFADLFEIKKRSVKKQGAISRHVGRDGELTLAYQREMFRLKRASAARPRRRSMGPACVSAFVSSRRLSGRRRSRCAYPAGQARSAPTRQICARRREHGPHVSPTGPRGRSVPVADLERQAHEIVPAGLNGREIQAFDDENLRAEQRAVNGRPLVSAMYLHNGPASS